jgi:hypothetical protein
MTTSQTFVREEIRREWDAEAAQSKRSFEALRLHLHPELFFHRESEPLKRVPPPKPLGEYLTTAQAAALANRTPATIRRWARLNLIPLTDLPSKDGKLSRVYTIPTDPFKLWLKNRTRNVPPEGPLGKAAL